MSYPRTALISDLHANLPALETALADVVERGIERVVCLGDVVGYGGSPRECVDLLVAHSGENAGQHGLAPGFCLQGNHEYALLNSAEDFNPNARAAIDWTRDQFSHGVDREEGYDYWDFFGGLEPLLQEDGVIYAHGSPRDPVREYMLPSHIRDREKMDANFACMDGRICFVGHSHVPAVYFEDGRLYRPRDTEGPYDLGDLGANRAIVNVGSVGQPRDGDRRLSYAIYDGRALSFVRLEYDVDRAMADIRAVEALPEYLAARLGEGR